MLFGGIVIWAVVLAWWDIKYQRLPDFLTLPAAAVAVMAALISDPSLLWGAVLWAGLYMVVGLTLGGIGGGDVKLAVTLGVLTASISIVLTLIAMIASSMLTAAIAAKKGSAPHGPSMLGAALVGCAIF